MSLGLQFSSPNYYSLTAKIDIAFTAKTWKQVERSFRLLHENKEKKKEQQETVHAQSSRKKSHVIRGSEASMQS